MYTLKFQDDQYYIIRPDGKNELDVFGKPVSFYSEEYARIAIDARNAKKSKKQTSSVRGVVDNRHRNWRKRSR